MASSDDRPFTKEDIRSLLNIGKKILTNNGDKVIAVIKENLREVIDPNTRLTGRIKARYKALRDAGFSHDEAARYTGESVNKAMDTVLQSLDEIKE